MYSGAVIPGTSGFQSTLTASVIGRAFLGVIGGRFQDFFGVPNVGPALQRVVSGEVTGRNDGSECEAKQGERTISLFRPHSFDIPKETTGVGLDLVAFDSCQGHFELVFGTVSWVFAAHSIRYTLSDLRSHLACGPVLGSHYDTS